MLNLVSFEMPPIGRQERSANTTITATATAAIRGKEESPSNTCFHGHLDLSLGISLSHGGGGSCDASSCGGYKQEGYGGRQAGSRDDKDGILCMTTAGTSTANVVTTGHGHVGDLTASGSGGGGWAAAFMPSPTGFMHPWSLAARQQKAAVEQDRTPPTTYMAR